MASFGCGQAGKGPLGKDVSVVHHRPPKETAADVGYPVRGGQTLLIAYFPWEASEADIEQAFSKFCRVKRVHLVVDKSSRKPRCFGFVKFMSKGDAEEALRATMMGMVQLPDTRGHVWHLKAEWTKSGDMVVDDSDAEQEVAKRKEERKGSRPEWAAEVFGQVSRKANEAARIKAARGPPSPFKAPFPSSLPSLYAAAQSVAPQMPLLQSGPPGVPPLLPQHAASPLPTGPPQQHNYGLVPGGVQQSLPMYSSYGGPPPTVPPYPTGLPGTSLPGVAPRASLLEAPHPGMPQLPLRDLLSNASPGMPHQAYSPGYPPGGYGPPPPPQGAYVGGQGFPPGQPPYATHAPNSYAGQQAAYSSNAPAYPGPPHQDPYTAAPSPYASVYPSHHPGIASQPGYAQPPSYASQAPGYAPPQIAGHAASYASAAHQSYPAGYSVGHQGLIHPGAHGGQPAGSYGYSPHMNAVSPPPLSVADGTYPGHMPPATGLQQHPLQGQQLDEAMPTVAPNSGGMYSSPPPQQAYDQSGVAAQMMIMPNTQTAPQMGSQSPSQVPQETSSHHDPGEVASHVAIGNAQVIATTSSLVASVAASQEYLHDVFMHFPDMSMHDKNNAAVANVPAPPPQQPPAPPAMQVPPASGQWQAPSVNAGQHQPTPQGPQDWNVPTPTVATNGQSVRPPAPQGTGSPAMWLGNSFDDAAAKGMDRMVDGLVGEDGVSLPNVPWAVRSPPT